MNEDLLNRDVLLDTNVLVRLMDSGNPDHQVAWAAIVRLLWDRELCIVPQVLYEYWVVATRPIGGNNNGLGMNPSDVRKVVEALRGMFTFKKDERGIYDEWQKLVTQHDVKGKPAHDARLVAAMSRHHLNFLLTFNGKDFKRFTNINVLSPQDVATWSLQLP